VGSTIIVLTVKESSRLSVILIFKYSYWLCQILEFTLIISPGMFSETILKLVSHLQDVNINRIKISVFFIKVILWKRVSCFRED